MSEVNNNKAPAWFMVVAVVLFVWNLMGILAYFMQVTMSPEALAVLPDAHRELYENIPTWVTAAFATGVFGGALGTLLLILKKNLAGLVLQISLAAVLVQMAHTFFITKSYEVLGSSAMVMPVTVIIIAVYLVILAAKAKTNRWTS